MAERVPDEHELRDEMVEHYHSYARSRGVDPSTRDLETLAAADLALVDQYEAAAKPAVQKQPAELAPREEPAPAETMARDKGYRFAKTALPAVDAPRAPPPLLEKPRALAKRMAQMCQTAGVSKSLSLADRTYVYPDLAKDVIQEHTDFTLRRRKYRDLNATDRQRAFWRAIEDIADRSTGRLGPWWVK